PNALLPELCKRRLYQRLLRSEFRSIGQGDANQIIHHGFRPNEGDAKVRRLERLDPSGGIQTQNPPEVGAGCSPALIRRTSNLLAASQLSTNPSDLDRRNDSDAGSRQLLRSVKQIGCPENRVLSASQFTARLLRIEVRFGRSQNAVVIRY